MSAAWTIRAAQEPDADAWCALRSALWPEEDAGAIAAGTRAYFGARADFEGRRKSVTWLAVGAGGVVVGFAEATLRNDHVNGTATSPVGFLEGLYVVPAHRRAGIGRALVAAVEGWVREAGCSELASDAYITSVASHAAHRAYGFEETERVVYFRKHV